MTNQDSKSYAIPSWVFLRLLGIIYFIAFLSLLVQIIGLVGKEGILPASLFLERAKEVFGNQCYLQFPTLFWINQSDWFLIFICFFGIILSILLFLNVFVFFVLFLLLVFYISLVTVCQDFLSFQWDNLLIETTFLSLFLGRMFIYLFWLLLFKLMFLSGLVKLLSFDLTWRNFTALTYHFETQPIPNLFSYYFHFLPEWFHKISCLIMFVIELVIPFLIFGPRKLKLVAFFAITLFQIVIFLTGNYCFFNLLTIALCVFLIEDTLWYRIFPFFKNHNSLSTNQVINCPKLFITLIFIFVLSINSYLLLRMFGINDPLLNGIKKIYSYIQPARLISTYGLFAVMTVNRPEIIIEGSNDGIKWKAYEFKYKADNLKRMPPFVAPHQPRLDWQMWFAALGDYKRNHWFINLCVRLLQGSKPVLLLLEYNPFPGNPPKYIRAFLYNYKFNPPSLKKQNGDWWQREKIGLYLPPISLR